MLYIDFLNPVEAIGKYQNFIFDPDLYFDVNFRPEWLDGDLQRQVVLDIDKSKVVSPYCIESPIFGQIPPHMLSGGVKAVLLMLQDDDDLIVWASACGDNCAKWILEIAKKKDIYIVLSHIMNFKTEDYTLEAFVVNDNAFIHSLSEYVDAGIRAEC